MGKRLAPRERQRLLGRLGYRIAREQRVPDPRVGVTGGNGPFERVTEDGPGAIGSATDRETYPS